MDLVYIGKLVNTHGIKGEVRILSDFEYKDVVFKKGNIIYIDDNKYEILSYRVHKNFDMVTLSNINSIDDALKFKGKSVYINKNDYKFDGYLNSELIGLDVYDIDEYKGKVVEVLKTSTNDLLVVDGKKRHMIPNIPEFIKRIDLDSKKIIAYYIKGLDNEN